MSEPTDDKECLRFYVEFIKSDWQMRIVNAVMDPDFFLFKDKQPVIQDHSIWNRLHQSERNYRKTMFTSEIRFGTMPLNPYRKMPIIYGREVIHTS